MKRLLVNIYNWFVKSSRCPSQYSLTLKGIVGVFIFWGISFGVNYTFINFDINDMVYNIIHVISIIGIVISALVALFGLVRKIYITFWY
jgi:hypothetical protein